MPEIVSTPVRLSKLHLTWSFSVAPQSPDVAGSTGVSAACAAASFSCVLFFAVAVTGSSYIIITKDINNAKKWRFIFNPS